MALETLEKLKTLCDYGVQIAVIFSFFFGIGALFLGSRIDAVQKGKLRQFELDLTGAKTALSEQQERTASVQLQALELQKQLVAQGSRVSLLYGENAEKLISALRPFEGQRAEVRYCDQLFNQYSTDHDSMGVAMLLPKLLEKGGWKVDGPIPARCGGTGLWVGVSPSAEEKAVSAGNALLAALKSVPLVASGPHGFGPDSPRSAQAANMFRADGTRYDLQPLGPDVIIVTVMAHP